MENTNNQSATASKQLIACHECDSLWSVHSLAPGQNLNCGCCGSRLRSRREHSMQKATALAFGAAAFFIVANLFPFISMEVSGQSNEISLLRGVFALYREGDSWLGGTIAFFIIGAPFMMIAGILYLALPIMLGKVPPGGVRVCRLMIGSGSWNMAEVFLLGVLVSLLKLGHMAHVVLGLSFWAFIGLIICLAAAWSSLDRATIWDRLEEGQTA
ncbi:MAG: paraquat-inducible protein A [Verrucomicrobiae bacterium]|nr:paraquat-inducible protein A [Verrucomicrobiae bacterium]